MSNGSETAATAYAPNIEYKTLETRYTYQDYCLLPEEKRCELIEGDFHMTPAPGRFHQDLVLRFARLIEDHVEARQLGKVYIAPFDVILSPFDVVQPDILFVRTERLAIIEERGLRSAPDLAVEILSPSTSARDLTMKRSLYFRYGVVEYWIVDPSARTVETLVRGAKQFETAGVYPESSSLISPLLPDLAAPLEKIFWS